MVGSLCFPLLMHASESDLRLYGGSDLETYLWMRELEPGDVSLVGPSGVKLLGFLRSSVRLRVLLGSFLNC